MPRTRKRPCRICRRWFYPDRRAGDRQRACSNPGCQTARRQKTQANWRAENPGYAAAYRIDQRHRDPTEEPEPLRVPAPFHQLPWDLAKDQFGGKGADFIALACTLLQRTAKDQSSSYPIDPKLVLSNNPAAPQKTSPQPAHTETRGADARVSSTGPPPGASPGPPPGAVPATVGVAG
jgi:hypothetical protein